MVLSICSTIFTIFARWRFRLLFSAAYLSGMLLSDCSYRAINLIFIQIRTPSLEQVYPSMQSPPAPCGTGSASHQTVLHRYYGFIRPLLTHCFCFPIQVILRLPLPLQLSSLTRKRVGYEPGIREDVKRSPSVAQESILNHPCHDHPIAHYSAQVSACDGSVTSR